MRVLDLQERDRLQQTVDAVYLPLKTDSLDELDACWEALKLEKVHLEREFANPPTDDYRNIEVGESIAPDGRVTPHPDDLARAFRGMTGLEADRGALEKDARDWLEVRQRGDER